MARSRAAPATLACPCGGPARYADCCGPAHSGQRLPASAEALMRSRYSAYVLKLPDYLLATWLPATRPPAIDGLDEPRWLRLKIEGCSAGGPADGAGTVRFTAYYTVNGRAHRVHEISRFERIEGRWYYCAAEPDA